MRKHRSWFIGFGIGIIIGATMLQLILFAKDQAVMVAQEPLTQEQLNEEAARAGLLLMTSEQLDEKVSEAVAAIQEKSDPEEERDEGIGGTESALTPPGKTNEEEPSASPSDESEQPEEGTKTESEVTLHVSYGMSLTQVANELEKLGVIDDAADFIAKAKSVSKKMKVGTNVFKGKPTYEEIMNELVRKK
jgi:hypothetical protein